MQKPLGKCASCSMCELVTETFGHAARLAQEDQYYHCIAGVEDECKGKERNEEEIKNALVNYLCAYLTLLKVWDHYIMTDKYPYEQSFDELDVPAWIESCLDKIGLKHTVEQKRLAMLKFLQASDPNGCYTDGQSLVDCDSMMTYQWAERYFLWYSNNPLFSEHEAEDAIEAADRVIKGGLYDASMRVLDKLIEFPTMARVIYRRLWDAGALVVSRELEDS